MAIKTGKYYIVPASRPGSFVGLGPVPPVYPPYPSPLKIVGEWMKDTYVIESTGGDSYTIKHKIIRYFVGYDQYNDNVRLVRENEKKPVWAIDPGNGSGLYRIKLTNADQYWTAPGGDNAWDPIELHRENGDKAQEWKLVPAEDDW